jgi:hypothetical protein
MKIRTLAFGLALILGTAYADSTHLWVAKQGSIPVWMHPEHSKDEAPVLEAGTSEPLLELDNKDNLIKVKTGNGIIGWVDASAVRAWKKGEGQSIDLGEGKLQGYLDNPNSIYILDPSKDPPEAFQIRRDLADMISLEDNIDRETIERKYGENN